MITPRCTRIVALAMAGMAAWLLAPAGGLHAQTTTGRVSGVVSDSAGTPGSGADAQVVALNVATGMQRIVTAQATGQYTLPGLVPGNYDLTARKIGAAPQTQRIAVGIGQNLIVNFRLQSQIVQLQEVAIRSAPPETRTSEVATNVTPVQIERLPTPGRNFLDLAGLAPGVTVSEDRVTGQPAARTFQGGGQSPNAVNVFIDGTSLKNDLSIGGVVGQDASRGNPFPRNAIQEYRVISQNFKAEYQKSSSSLITATTKSGGNVWSGSAFFNFQNQSLIALDTFSTADKLANPTTFTKPDYKRFLGGASLGGPIIKDRLTFFGSYEGNYQNRNNRVAFAPPTGFPALDTVNLAQYNGQFLSPFRETLLFGKLTYAVSPTSTADLSVSNRHETEVRDFGPCCGAGFNAFQEAANLRQNTALVQAHYNIFSGDWLNEAKLDYSRFRRNPSPNEPGFPQRVFQLPGGDAVIGSSRSNQDFLQKRVGLRDDITYTGFRAAGQHVVKAGVSADLVKYDVLKDNNSTPQFLYNSAYGYQSPFQLTYGTGNAALKKSNNEIGLYAQDDWSPTPRLTLNAGLRWDFETNMMNTDYVTPQIVIDTLTRYNDQLPHPLDLTRFISTGNNRSPFYGAVQPRFGFSYALDRDSRTTIFGGFGIYYDRNLFDVSVDETLKLTHPDYTIQFAAPGQAPGPGQVAWSDSYLTTDRAVLDQLVGTFGKPEAWLIDNKVKVPKSRQWNFGVRHSLGTVNISATYAGVRGVDQLTLNWANFGLNPDGTCCVSFNTADHGFSNFIYSSNDAKTWYDALLIGLDRPYRRADKIGWGAGISFTYAVRSLQGTDNLGDLFAFPNTQNIPKHPANDERARIVANWITDVPYVFGLQFSGLITLGSGAKQDIGGPIRFNPNGYVRGGFSPPGRNFLIFGKWAYRNVDIRLRKDLPNFGRGNLGITADLFNVFNYDNFGCFATPANHADGTADINLGKPSCVVSDPRRLQIGAQFDF